MACAFVSVCSVKTQQTKRDYFGEEPIYLGFNAGGIHRLDYRVPTTYFGKCVAFGLLRAMKDELLCEDGVVVAAKAIEIVIKELDKEVLRDAEQWICEWEELLGSYVHVMGVGSPKVDLYETDFGWGKPNKIDKVSVDCINAIYLTESRDLKDGIDVGASLNKASMDSFTCLFHDGLKLLP